MRGLPPALPLDGRPLTADAVDPSPCSCVDGIEAVVCPCGYDPLLAGASTCERCRRRVRINVSGQRFEIRAGLLSRHPSTYRTDPRLPSRAQGVAAGTRRRCSAMPRADAATTTVDATSCSSTATVRASRPCSPTTSTAADCAGPATSPTTSSSPSSSSTSWIGVRRDDDGTSTCPLM